jgi:small subunit ribosomal protein S18
MTSSKYSDRGDKGGRGGDRGSDRGGDRGGKGDKDKDGPRRRQADYFHQNRTVEIDYKNVDLMRRFISPEGKILPGRRSSLTSRNQRKVSRAIKQARAVGLLPFTNHDA